MSPESFKEKYFSLHPKLYRVAFAILGNQDDAEDMVQDTYCKLWDNRNKLDAVENPEAYCFIIIKRLCLDFLKKNIHLRLEDIQELSIQDDYRADEELDNKETLEKVKFIIKTLPEKQREILKLKCFAECSYEEIEKITGESSSNVRVLLSRARNTIKTKLKL
jgi:RNA polymerase sigma-70 factor (ECF subfamily)